MQTDQFSDHSFWVINAKHVTFLLLRKFLAASGYNPDKVFLYTDIDEAGSSKHRPVLVFIDYSPTDDITKISNLPDLYPDIPVILIVDSKDEEHSLDAAKLGAHDYPVKNEISLPLFRKSVQYAIDRTEIRNKLRKSKNDYESIFQQHPLPMWLFSIETLRFIKVNDAAVHYYGYSAEEFLKMTIQDIRPQEDKEALLHTVKRSDKSGFYDDNKWRHLKKNGEIIYVHVYSYNTVFEGINCRMVTAVNMNREHELEQLLANR